MHRPCRGDAIRDGEHLGPPVEEVHYVDSWSLYHRMLGGVRSGVSVEAPPSSDVAWWTAMTL